MKGHFHLLSCVRSTVLNITSKSCEENTLFYGREDISQNKNKVFLYLCLYNFKPDLYLAIFVEITLSIEIIVFHFL